jgi:hypothetical protein
MTFRSKNLSEGSIRARVGRKWNQLTMTRNEGTYLALGCTYGCTGSRFWQLTEGYKSSILTIGVVLLLFTGWL